MGFITDKCRELRNNPTEAEKKLWEGLRKRRRKGYKFLRQFPLIVASRQGKTEFYIADFYCAAAKLVVEVDGGYHNSPEQLEDDKLRDKISLALGLRTIRFTNKQVMENMASVLKEIEYACLNYPPQPSL